MSAMEANGIAPNILTDTNLNYEVVNGHLG